MKKYDNLSIVLNMIVMGTKVTWDNPVVYKNIPLEGLKHLFGNIPIIDVACSDKVAFTNYKETDQFGLFVDKSVLYQDRKDKLIIELSAANNATCIDIEAKMTHSFQYAMLGTNILLDLSTFAYYLRINTSWQPIPIWQPLPNWNPK